MVRRMPASHGTDDPKPSKRPRVLEPIERQSEVLFGLIMVLTFTGSLSVASDGRQEVRTMLIGALGCNIAWGIVDGVMYVMGRLAERGRGLAILHAVRRAKQPDEARRIVSDALPPVVAEILDPQELDHLRRGLLELPEPPAQAGMTRDDFLGALGVFLLVVFSTIPVALPFVFVEDTGRSLRLSNAVALAMLFVIGWSFGRASGRRRPWLTGMTMVGIGVVLVAMTMALGG